MGKVNPSTILIFVLSSIAIYLSTLIQTLDAFSMVVGASFGMLLVVCILATCYIKCGFHLVPQNLKILDFILIVLNAVMMGVFQWLGANEIIYWVLIIVIPSFLVRVGITYYNKRLPKHEQN